MAKSIVVGNLVYTLGIPRKDLVTFQNALKGISTGATQATTSAKKMDAQLRLMTRDAKALRDRTISLRDAWKAGVVSSEQFRSRMKLIRVEATQLQQKILQTRGRTGELTQAFRLAGRAATNAAGNLDRYANRMQLTQLRTELGLGVTTLLNDQFFRMSPALGILTGRLQQASGSMGNFIKTAAPIVAVAASVIGLAAAFVKASGAGIELETAMANIQKTTDLTDAALDSLITAVQDIAQALPVATAELLEVARVAGQLGIQGSANIALFTEAIAQLSVATNVVGEEGASQLARFLQATGTEFNQLGREALRVGNVMNQLENTMAATAAEILETTRFTSQLSTQAEVSRIDILALGAATLSLGQRSEAAGSALARTFSDISSAAVDGGTSLGAFAEAADLTSEEFQNLALNNPVEAFFALIEGMAQSREEGQNLNQVLAELGINEVRQRRVLLALAGGIDVVTRARKEAFEEAVRGNSLQEETARILNTTAGQWQLLRNNIGILLQQQGRRLTPFFQAVLSGFNAWIKGAVDASQANDDVLLSVEKLSATLEEYDAGLDSARDGVNKLAEATDIGGLRSAVIDLAGALEGASRTAFADFSTDLLTLTEQTGDFGGAIDALIDKFIEMRIQAISQAGDLRQSIRDSERLIAELGRQFGFDEEAARDDPRQGSRFRENFRTQIANIMQTSREARDAARELFTNLVQLETSAEGRVRANAIIRGILTGQIAINEALATEIDNSSVLKGLKFDLLDAEDERATAMLTILQGQERLNRLEEERAGLLKIEQDFANGLIDAQEKLLRVRQLFGFESLDSPVTGTGGGQDEIDKLRQSLLESTRSLVRDFIQVGETTPQGIRGFAAAMAETLAEARQEINKFEEDLFKRFQSGEVTLPMFEVSFETLKGAIRELDFFDLMFGEEFFQDVADGLLDLGTKFPEVGELFPFRPEVTVEVAEFEPAKDIAVPDVTVKVAEFELKDVPVPNVGVEVSEFILKDVPVPAIAVQIEEFVLKDVPVPDVTAQVAEFEPPMPFTFIPDVTVQVSEFKDIPVPTVDINIGEYKRVPVPNVAVSISEFDPDKPFTFIPDVVVEIKEFVLKDVPVPDVQATVSEFESKGIPVPGIAVEVKDLVFSSVVIKTEAQRLAEVFGREFANRLRTVGVNPFAPTAGTGAGVLPPENVPSGRELFEQFAGKGVTQVADATMAVLGGLGSAFGTFNQEAVSAITGVGSSLMQLAPMLGPAGPFAAAIGMGLQILGSFIGVLGDLGNGAAEVRKQIDELAQSTALLSKQVIETIVATKTVSRGGIAGFFGFTKQVIDEELTDARLEIAESIVGGLVDVFNTAVDQFLQKSDLWADTLRKGIREIFADALKKALVESLILGSAFQDLLGQFTILLEQGDVAGAFEFLADNLESVLDGVTEGFEEALESMPPELREFFEEFVDAADEIAGGGGVQISEITGPTRDLLIDLLSPLSALPALIESNRGQLVELIRIRTILSTMSFMGGFGSGAMMPPGGPIIVNVTSPAPAIRPQVSTDPSGDTIEVGNLGPLRSILEDLLRPLAALPAFLESLRAIFEKGVQIDINLPIMHHLANIDLWTREASFGVTSSNFWLKKLWEGLVGGDPGEMPIFPTNAPQEEGSTSPPVSSQPRIGASREVLTDLLRPLASLPAFLESLRNLLRDMQTGSETNDLLDTVVSRLMEDIELSRERNDVLGSLHELARTRNSLLETLVDDLVDSVEDWLEELKDLDPDDIVLGTPIPQLPQPSEQISLLTDIREFTRETGRQLLGTNSLLTLAVNRLTQIGETLGTPPGTAPPPPVGDPIPLGPVSGSGAVSIQSLTINSSATNADQLFREISAKTKNLRRGGR